MVTILKQHSAMANDALMSRHNLMVTAAKYIYSGSSAVIPEDLETARNEMRRLIFLGKTSGLSERDMVVGFMRPLLSLSEHCRCPACRQRCAGCRDGDLDEGCPPP
jgi:hypothetical protein